MILFVDGENVVVLNFTFTWNFSSLISYRSKRPLNGQLKNRKQGRQSQRFIDVNSISYLMKIMKFYFHVNTLPTGFPDSNPEF